MATSHDYEGFAFHDQFPRGRASGRLSPGSTRITFRSDNGSHELPLKGLTIRLGGNNKRLVFLEHPSHPDWSFYTADHTLLNDPNLLSLQDLADQIKRLQRGKIAAKGVMLAVVATLALALVGLWSARPWVVSTLAEQVPPSWENELGDFVIGQYMVGKREVQNRAVEKALADITDALTKHMGDKPYEFHFRIVEDPALNAFALPGGQVVINSGTVLQAERAEEVLGVVAHEIAHVTERHGIRKMINSMGLVVLAQALIGDGTAFLAFLKEASPYLIEQQHSRDSEREADARGLDYLVAADIDPSGMVDFFQRLQETYGGGALEEKLAFLSTHPATGERIDNLKQAIAERKVGETRDLSAQMTALQQSLRAALEEGTDTNEN